jgi:hypothetical protein
MREFVIAESGRNALDGIGASDIIRADQSHASAAHSAENIPPRLACDERLRPRRHGAHEAGEFLVIEVMQEEIRQAKVNGRIHRTIRPLEYVASLDR